MRASGHSGRPCRGGEQAAAALEQPLQQLRAPRVHGEVEERRREGLCEGGERRGVGGVDRVEGGGGERRVARARDLVLQLAPPAREHLRVQRRHAPPAHDDVVTQRERDGVRGDGARDGRGPRREDAEAVRRAVVEQAEDRPRQVVLHRPRELVLHPLRRHAAVPHEVLNAVSVLALDGNVEGVDAVAVGRVDVGLRRQQEASQLDVAARERVVQRRAAAAVLPVVGVGASIDEHRRNG